MKIRLLFYGLVFLIMVNCSSNTDEKKEHNLRNERITLPNDIQSLENLTLLSDSVSSHTIHFEKVAVFRDAEQQDLDSIYIGNMSNMAVDTEGRVFVATNSGTFSQSIYIYNADGTYLKKIGRSGRGPGEFVKISNIEIKSEKLYAYDEILFRLSIFSLQDLQYSDQITLRPQSWQNIKTLNKFRASNRYFPRNNGSVLMEFKGPPRILSYLGDRTNAENKKQRYTRYYLINKNGEIDSEQIFEQKDLVFGESSVLPFEEGNLPFVRNPLIAVGNDGKIYSADEGDFLIKVYSPSGKYLRAIYYPYQKTPLNSNKIISKYSESSKAKEVAEKANYPETWPALNKLIIDDENRLWVSTITKSDSTFNWWVISKAGVLLARFDWLGEKLNRGVHGWSKVMTIKKDHLYTYEVAKDSKYVGDIVKYKIHFKKR